MSNLSKEEIAEALERTTKIKADTGYSSIDILRPQPGDIVVGHFPPWEYDIDTMQQVHSSFSSILPDEVSLISIFDDMDFECLSRSEYIRHMFDDMDLKLGRQEFIRALRDELFRLDGDDLK